MQIEIKIILTLCMVVFACCAIAGASIDQMVWHNNKLAKLVVKSCACIVGLCFFGMFLTGMVWLWSL